MAFYRGFVFSEHVKKIAKDKQLPKAVGGGCVLYVTELVTQPPNPRITCILILIQTCVHGIENCGLGLLSGRNPSSIRSCKKRPRNAHRYPLECTLRLWLDMYKIGKFHPSSYDASPSSSPLIPRDEDDAHRIGEPLPLSPGPDFESWSQSFSWTTQDQWY